MPKNKFLLVEGEGIFTVSECCEDVVKTAAGEDWPVLRLNLKTLTENPMQEIPRGEGKCDFCDKKIEVSGLKIKFIP
jgi:hypothetical protein